MKTLLVLVILLLGSTIFARAQTVKDTTTAQTTLNKNALTANPQGSMTAYKGKTYIFDSNHDLWTCDAAGYSSASDSIKIAFKGYLFQVVSVFVDSKTSTTELVIKFQNFPRNDPDHRNMYNLLPSHKDDPKITNENSRYFVISQNDFSTICSEYISPHSTTVTFGTFTTPFKFRPTKSLFTSDLTLGTVAYLNLKFSDALSYGVAAGISLTSVTLDSLSTKGKTRSSSDRPALTPSFSYVLSYNNVSFTFGVGIDYINKTTDIERSWIFNGKPWFGFGIGLNLFGASNSNSTAANSGQKK